MSGSRIRSLRSGIMAGFWPSWYASSTPPSSIPKSYYTHVFYAFVNPDPGANFTLKITPTDKRLMPRFTGHLHSNNHYVKAFLSIGGANEEAKEAWSAMACSQTNRGHFIRSAIEVARQYGFDGVDLNWEFPSEEIGMEHLASLLTELRLAVDQEAHQTRLGISATVYFAPYLDIMTSTGGQYPAAAIAKNVDFINLMSYNYSGSWDTTRTGSLAALYNNGGVYCTHYGIEEWIEIGVPPEKLVMGLPLYGQSWKLRDPNNNGIGAPAVGTGPEDSQYEKGSMVYRNVVKFIADRRATEVYDPFTVSCYCHAGTDWISYDGVQSIEAKVRYAKDHHLGGYYFWAIGQDYQDRLSTAG
ncbi:hypothetical protein MKW94_002096 [Papaver nudicaule]|uniref:GH18 domain-containing protein n=1 Tax=Papaver nudicaule TaxID=74823 RepID=A0AA41RPR7_PAPNU|nr:hypothetical protein [Papaver nudicaule]